MTDQTSITNAGAVALGGGSVTINAGLFGAGRDIFVEQLNVLMADHAPSPASGTIVPGHIGDICPFPGLDPFGAAEAKYFFGREDDTRVVLGLIGPGQFAAVIGSSGSGKSSLLAAAVVPALAAGAQDRPRMFPIVIKPGRLPVHIVAERLAPHLPGQSAARLVEDIRHDPGALARWSDQAAQTLGRPLIWLVDQFEEIFDPAVPEADRTALLEGLRAGRASGVVLAMRSDFYQHLDRSPGLAQLVAARQHRLTTLGGGSLREIIVRPADQVHLRVEPGLIDQVVRDLSDQAASGGALPFVAMALKETWRHRANGWLTIAGYLQSGGVVGAIQQTADATWAKLAPGDQPAARRMLMRMAHVSADGVVTRRRCPATEFVTEADSQDAVLRVLQLLVRSRLLTMDAPPATSLDDEQGPAPTVEIAHETLLTAWPLLREWLTTDRDVKRLQDDLASATAAWEQSSRDGAFLYTGVRLATLSSARGTLTTNAAESAFIRASIRLAGRQTRRTRLLIALPIGLVVAMVVAGLAVVQQRATMRQKTLSDALQLSAEARAESPDNRDLAALLATAADQVVHNPTTWGTLVDTLGSSQGPMTVIRGRAGPITAIAPQLSGSGQVLVGGSDGRAELRSASDGAGSTPIVTGRSILRARVSGPYALTEDVAGNLTLSTLSPIGPPVLRIPAGAPSWDLVLDAPHHLIAAAGSDSHLRRWWYAADPDGTARITRSRSDPIAAVSLVAVKDGGLLATTLAGSLDYLGGATGTPVELLGEHTFRPSTRMALALKTFTGPAEPDEVSGLRGRLAVLDDAALSTWTLRTRGGRAELSEPASVPYPGGSAITADLATGELMTGTSTGTLSRWLTAPSLVPWATFTGGGTGPIREIAADGKWVVARTGAGTAVAWNLDGVSSPATHDLAFGMREQASAAYAASGALAVGGTDGEVVVLPAAGSASPKPVRAGQVLDASITSVAWSGPDVLAGASNGTVTVFDLQGTATSLRPPRAAGVSAIAATGSLIALGWQDGSVELTRDGRDQRLTGTGSSGYSLALSRDGRWLAAGTGDQDDDDVLLWDLAHRGPPRHLRGHHLFVSALAFSPDGTTLASGSDDQEIRLWSTETGRPSLLLAGHEDTVRAIAFAPDGKTLASAGDEGSIRLWDPVTGRAVGRPLGLGGAPILSLTASPGSDLIVAAGNGQLFSAPLAPAAWRARACVFAGRELTEAERARYLPDRPAQVCGA